jgi:hypothetical protein
MALKHLSFGFSSSLVLPVRLGAGCLRLAASGFDVPGSTAGSFATVNRKFQPKTKPSGFGAFPAAKHFPFAINVPVLSVRLGAGCLRLASSGFDASGSAATSFATVNRKFEQNSKASGFGGFPALPSNTAVKAAPAFGLRWTLRDKASRSAPYLQRWATK